MTIFGRLVVKEWIKAFLFSTLILFLLVSIANIVAELLRGVSTFEIILRHYALELPHWLSKILPLSCLNGTLFSMQKLKNRNELIALFASGLSRRALIILVSQVALVVTLFQLLLTGQVLPWAKKMRQVYLKGHTSEFRGEKEKGLKTSSLASGKIWYKSAEYFCSFSAYDKRNKKLRDISLYYYDQNNRLTQFVEAESARFVEGKGWQFVHGRDFGSLHGNDFPVAKIFKERILPFKESDQDFEDLESDITELDLIRLYSYVNKIEKLGINSSEYKILFYEKFSSSLICLLFALLSLSPIYQPGRRGSSFGRNVFFVFVFSLGYWFLYSSALALGGQDKMPPLMAAFSLPILCFFYLSCLFWKYRNI